MHANMKKAMKILSEEKKELLIKQDLKFVKLLAGNNPRLTKRAIKTLRKWMERRAVQMPLNEDDYMRIWKGLFYAMWKSDKPLAQEECAESISNLIHLDKPNNSLQFFKCGLITLCNEWFGIDQLRLNKFLMFVRRLIRQGLQILNKTKWNLNLLNTFNDSLLATVLNNNTTQGLTLHFIEIYLEEVAKVSEGAIKHKILIALLDPFAKFLAIAKDQRQRTHIMKYIFRYLMQQSDVGLDYEERFQVWKREGFPGGTIKTIQKVPVEDEEEIEEEEKTSILDPRAGHVDVELPQLHFDPKVIVKLLTKYRFDPESTTGSRKNILKIIKEFERLKKNEFPLGIHKVDLIRGDNYEERINEAVERLDHFDQEQLGDKSRKKKVEPVGSVKKKKKINGSLNKTLEQFIQESEVAINQPPVEIKVKRRQKPKTKKSSIQSLINDNWVVENNFKRNSGLWVVSRERNELEGEKSPPPNKTSPTKRITPIKVSEPKIEPKENGWSTPLKQGETEFFVVSNKFKKKLKSEKPKERFSLDSKIVKNKVKKQRLSLNSNNNSLKKVKIDLKMNKSQEMHDFLEQIRNSPAIPFDGNKKPLKSLLKPNLMASPINPFYKRKLGFT